MSKRPSPRLRQPDVRSLGAMANMREAKRVKREASSPECHHDDLLQLARKCGATLDGVQITRADSNTGGQHRLCASRSLSRGHVAAILPAHLMLTTDRALASPEGRQIAGACSVMSDSEIAGWVAGCRSEGDGEDPSEPPSFLTHRSVLCAFLIARRWGDRQSSEKSTASDEDSLLGAYIQSLPGPDDVETPIMWGAESLAFQVPELEQETRDRLLHLSQQLDLLTQHFEMLDGVVLTRERWHWAHGICTSRFCKQAEDQEGESCSHDGALVPIVDMMNHSVQSNVEYIPPGQTAAGLLESCGAALTEQTMGGLLVVTEPVQAGKELLYCYGAKPNSDLVRGYGFAQWDNLHERLPLLIQLEHVLESMGPEGIEPTASPDWVKMQLDFQSATGASDGEFLVEFSLVEGGTLPAEAMRAARSCARALIRASEEWRQGDAPKGLDHESYVAKSVLVALLEGKREQLMCLDESLEDGCTEDDRRDALNSMKQMGAVSEAATLCFGSQQEWEDYVAQIRGKAGVNVGGYVFATGAEGCGVATRSSQLNVLMMVLSELEGELGEDDVTLEEDR